MAFWKKQQTAEPRPYAPPAETADVGTAADVDAVMRLLRDKGWGDNSDCRPEELLALEENKLWEFINETVDDISVLNFLLIPNDYHNLKAALKGRIVQTEWEKYCIYPTTVEIEAVKSAVESKNFEALPGKMAAAAKEAYDALVSCGDGQRCDMVIDAASLEAAIEAAKKSGGVLLEFAQLNAFRADIRIAVRCARMKKPLNIIRPALAQCQAIDADKLAAAAVQGEEAICDLLAETDRDAADALRKGLGAFERLCDQRMDDRLMYTKYTSLGVEPIVSYIHARQKEMRQVRIILAGQRNSVPAERIRELM